MNIQVAIPTKSRYNTKTYKIFQDAGFNVYHFIEPNEFNLYDVPNKININKNNKGIGYVRNYILNWAKENNHSWVIVCDDDVEGFGIYNGRTKKLTANIWQDIYEKSKELPFEIIGINYVQHAWHEKSAISINKKFAEVCVLLNIKNISWIYRTEFNMKEDRDFCLQAIKNGNGVLRYNYYWFQCPNVGSNSGGLQNEYANKKDEESAKKMALEWHPFIKLQKKGNRIDMKTDIKKIAEHYKKYIQ